MVDSLMALLLRAKEILQTEGLMPLLGRGFVFLAGYLFSYKHYCLYEHTLEGKNEADFLPEIQDYTLKIVSTRQQADELAGSFKLDSHLIAAGRKLDKGAVAFCVFIDGELAHIAWLAMSQEAKNTFDPLPCRVNFSGKQGCTGSAWTHPRYRGRGLMVYCYFKRLQFLWERGFRSSRNIVSMTNVISRRGQVRLGPKMYAKARYLRILWWDSWKETPLS
jgi:hypothetical protein